MLKKRVANVMNEVYHSLKSAYQELGQNCVATFTIFVFLVYAYMLGARVSIAFFMIRKLPQIKSIAQTLYCMGKFLP